MRMWLFSVSVAALLLNGILAAQVRESTVEAGRHAGETQHPGDPVRGRAIFEGKGHCTSCHRVGDSGSALGPNLTAAGTELTVDQLRNSLLDPNPTVPPAYQRYRVITRDGKAISGRLLNQDPYSLQMIDSDNQLVAFGRSELREWGSMQTPPMPSYRRTLNADELADVLAYLASLKGVGHP
jgi:putative heme-binding domain-containing protein